MGYQMGHYITRWVNILPDGSLYYQMGQYITRWVNIMGQLPDGSLYNYITSHILPGSLYYQMGHYITRWVNYITRWVIILPDGSLYYQMVNYITRWVIILPDGSIYYLDVVPALSNHISVTVTSFSNVICISRVCVDVCTVISYIRNLS